MAEQPQAVITPGPWRWELNEKSRVVQLCGGVPRYDLTVMDFVRYGFNGAAPRLREPIPDRLNIMHRIERWGAVVPGREHHSGWFKAIDHPDARLIEAAPDLYTACAAFRAAMQGNGDVPMPGPMARGLVEAHCLVVAAMDRAEGRGEGEAR